MGTLKSKKYNLADCTAKLFDAFDGTYSFCCKCKKKKNCCVKVRKHGGMSRPIIFADEIENIKKYTGENPASFSVCWPSAKNGARILKAHRHGCHFCDKGKCRIYPVRPLDCRLFPIDIMEKKDGSLTWIAYTETCPIKYDRKDCFEKAKKLLPNLRDNVRDYARVEAPWMFGQPYIELGDIDTNRIL